MQPNPNNEDTVLCADLIAPEGYGEIIGGSERINDLELLEQRIDEHQLDTESYNYYLDLRRYGSATQWFWFRFRTHSCMDFRR